MSVFSSMNISASGMNAQKLRMDTISSNLANINTTKAKNGEPYRRKVVLFKEAPNNNSFDNILNGYYNNNSNALNGVEVSKVVEDTSPFITVYDPTHPDADSNGYVSMPNVNTVTEMTNLIAANRSYEANITALNAAKGILTKTLEIGK